MRKSPFDARPAWINLHATPFSLNDFDRCIGPVRKESKYGHIPFSIHFIYSSNRPHIRRQFDALRKTRGWIFRSFAIYAKPCANLAMDENDTVWIDANIDICIMDSIQHNRISIYPDRKYTLANGWIKSPTPSLLYSHTVLLCKNFFQQVNYAFKLENFRKKEKALPAITGRARGVKNVNCRFFHQHVEPVFSARRATCREAPGSPPSRQPSLS